MELHKKSFLFKGIKLFILIVVLMLLFFLIKYKWDVTAALNDMLELFRLKQKN